MTSSDRRASAAGPTSWIYLAWVGFAVLAMLYVAMAQVPSPGALQLVLGDLGFLGLIAADTVLLVWTARRSRGAERRLWVVVLVTYALLLVSELYWLGIIVVTGTPPPPIYAPFQALHVAAALMYLVSVASLTPLRGRHGLVTARQSLDVVSFGIVVYVASFFFSVNPFFRTLQGTVAADALVGAVYPTWSVLMIAGLLWPLAASGGTYRYRSWEKLLVFGLAAYALAIGAWPLWFAWAADVAGAGERALIDAVQMLSHFLILLALVRRAQSSAQPWSPPRQDALPNSLARVASYSMLGLVMAALPLQIVLALAAPAGSLVRLVLSYSSTGLAVLTVARTLLTAIESGRLLRSSSTDPLTGLANNRSFHESLAAAVDLAGRFDEQVAVIVLDLDDFDEVNNRHGHPHGDEVLRHVAAALQDTCAPTAVVSRVGGDEFACVIPGAGAEAALEVARRMRRALAGLVVGDGTRVTASSGIAVFPDNADEAEQVVRLADGAAYWVKRHGKDHALIYDPNVVTRLSADELAQALALEVQGGVIRALAAASDARHEHTSTHSVAVAAWAIDVAKRLGLDENRVRMVETAALLHDVGMIAVGEQVLATAGGLNESDGEEVREHPGLGERIVASSMPVPVRLAIRYHHERWDGAGYPDGLVGDEIPLEARIICVCGSYDAMTSPRPYRSALSVSEAVERLRDGAGSQFDPAVVDAFINGLGALGRLRDDF